MSIIQFNTLTKCYSGLGIRKLCNTFWKLFTRKRGFPKVCSLIWNYLENVSCNIMYEICWQRSPKKHFFQNGRKDRMTHFNISVTVKRRKDNSLFNSKFTNFRQMFHFYIPWRHQKTRGFPNILRECRNGTLAWNGFAGAAPF